MLCSCSAGDEGPGEIRGQGQERQDNGRNTMEICLLRISMGEEGEVYASTVG